MSEYLILIYEDQSLYPGPNDPGWGDIMAAHQKFGENNGASIRGGNALQHTPTATSIRGDGKGGRELHAHPKSWPTRAGRLKAATSRAMSSNSRPKNGMM